MPSTEKKHLLKVFSGPHVGAEVLLGDGEHILGSGENCDVILNDRFIGEQHARLVIQGNEVDCAPVDGSKVFIDGKEISDAKLEPFEYFTIGNTHLAVGPNDKPWPNRDFPDFQLGTATQEETSPAQQAEGNEAETKETDDLSAAARDERGESEKPSNQPANAAPAEHLPAHRRLQWIVSGAFLFVLFSGGAVVFFFPDLSSGQSSDAHAVTLADLQSVIAAEAPNSTVKPAQEYGYFAVRGYVVKRDVKDQLENALLALDPNLEMDIADTESLASAAQTVLDMHHLSSLKTSAGKPGQVVVSGAVNDPAKWGEVRESIRRDVVKIQDLDESQVTTPGGQTARTETADDVVPNHDEPLHLAIRSLSIGRRRMLTAANGEQVFEGGMLSSGYVLKSIEADRLILSKADKELLITLGTEP